MRGPGPDGFTPFNGDIGAGHGRAATGCSVAEVLIRTSFSRAEYMNSFINPARSPYMLQMVLHPDSGATAVTRSRWLYLDLRYDWAKLVDDMFFYKRDIELKDEEDLEEVASAWSKYKGGLVDDLLKHGASVEGQLPALEQRLRIHEQRLFNIGGHYLQPCVSVAESDEINSKWRLNTTFCTDPGYDEKSPMWKPSLILSRKQRITSFFHSTDEQFDPKSGFYIVKIPPGVAFYHGSSGFKQAIVSGTLRGETPPTIPGRTVLSKLPRLKVLEIGKHTYFGPHDLTVRFAGSDKYSFALRSKRELTLLQFIQFENLHRLLNHAPSGVYNPFLENELISKRKREHGDAPDALDLSFEELQDNVVKGIHKLFPHASAEELEHRIETSLPADIGVGDMLRAIYGLHDQRDALPLCRTCDEGKCTVTKSRFASVENNRVIMAYLNHYLKLAYPHIDGVALPEIDTMVYETGHDQLAQSELVLFDPEACVARDFDNKLDASCFPPTLLDIGAELRVGRKVKIAGGTHSGNKGKVTSINKTHAGVWVEALMTNLWAKLGDIELV